MSVLEQERTAALWAVAAILAYMAEIITVIVVILFAQAFISIIASIILSYKHYGTKKPKTRKAARSRRG